MRSLLLHGVLALLAALLDTSVLSLWTTQPFVPQLVLCGVLYASVTHQTKAVLMWAWVGGVVVGLFTSVGFGVHLVVFLLTGQLVAMLAKNVLTNRSVISMLVQAVVGSGFAGVAMVLLSQLANWIRLTPLPMSWSSLAPGQLFGQAVANAAVLAVASLVYHRNRPTLTV